LLLERVFDEPKFIAEERRPVLFVHALGAAHDDQAGGIQFLGNRLALENPDDLDRDRFGNQAGRLNGVMLEDDDF